MYENNYNYIDVPEDKTPGKSGGARKTAALLLAVVLVGGASGYGGAYLHSTMNPAPAAVVQTNSVPQIQETPSEQPAVTTAAVQKDNTVSNLLGTSSPTGELSTSQIVEKVSPSVIGVHSSFQNGSGTGTGIVLSSDGYIITNAHVVQTEVTERDSNGAGGFGGFGNDYGDIFSYFFGNGGYGGGGYKKVVKNADKVSIVLSTGDETEYEAEIVGVDTNSDLAVLKVKDVTLTPAEFGDSDELAMGGKAIAIGYPVGLGLSTSEGIISGLNRTIDIELPGGGSTSMTLIQTDAAINPGNSGGPLINAYGQVVGITSSKLVDSSLEGLGFAIPISDAMPLISDLMNKGYVDTPQIGITGTNVNNAVMRYYGLPVDSGIMVVSVNEGSGAEAAGICAGDVIVAAEGKPITSMDELTAAKSGKSVGDTLTVTLARADGNVDVDIILTGENDQKPVTEVQEG